MAPQNLLAKLLRCDSFCLSALLYCLVAQIFDVVSAAGFVAELLKVSVPFRPRHLQFFLMRIHLSLFCSNPNYVNFGRFYLFPARSPVRLSTSRRKQKFC